MSVPFYTPNQPPAPPRQPKPGELLFEFIRASNGRPVRCELRFHGESAGWEAQFFDADLFSFYARGAFVTKALAVQWAEEERKALERGSSVLE